ncbi:MAG: hypothetical protein WC261_08045 [Synergistaceae bacterium]
MDRLYKEHLESPYVGRPLSREMFERLYMKLERVEKAAWDAMEHDKFELHDVLDRKSQKLCAALGY